QRAADGEVGRVGLILTAKLHVLERAAVRTEERQSTARWMQQADNAFEDEIEQIAHRPVGEELDRQRVEDFRALRSALFAVDLDRQVRSVRVAVDRNQLRRLIVRVKNDLAVAQ